VLPGGGALLASFGSYALEKKLSRHPERFGKGAIEGVAGPESANNAGAQTSFIPMLTLGIPSNAVMALMVAAMMLQGVAVGPNIAMQKPDLFWGLIASMWIGNLMLVLLNLPLIGIWVRLLTIPYWALFPFIIVFSAIGIFSVASNAYDLFTVTIFGILGYVLIKLDCEPTPLLLGFILGPMLEEHLIRSMIVARGDPAIFVTRPISAVLLLVALGLLVLVCLPAIAKKRQQVFAAGD
jgi:TctA family transporter